MINIKKLLTWTRQKTATNNNPNFAIFSIDFFQFIPFTTTSTKSQWTFWLELANFSYSNECVQFDDQLSTECFVLEPHLFNAHDFKCDVDQSQLAVFASIVFFIILSPCEKLCEWISTLEQRDQHRTKDSNALRSTHDIISLLLVLNFDYFFSHFGICLHPFVTRFLWIFWILTFSLLTNPLVIKMNK